MARRVYLDAKEERFISNVCLNIILSLVQEYSAEVIAIDRNLISDSSQSGQSSLSNKNKAFSRETKLNISIDISCYFVPPSPISTSFRSLISSAISLQYNHPHSPCYHTHSTHPSSCRHRCASCTRTRSRSTSCSRSTSSASRPTASPSPTPTLTRSRACRPCRTRCLSSNSTNPLCPTDSIIQANSRLARELIAHSSNRPRRRRSFTQTREYSRKSGGRRASAEGIRGRRDDRVEGVDVLRRPRAVNVVAVQAADPVCEERSSAHALRVREEIDSRCAVCGAC